MLARSPCRRPGRHAHAGVVPDGRASPLAHGSRAAPTLATASGHGSSGGGDHALRKRTLMGLALMSVVALAATATPATALIWNWTYSGAGITAGGTFTTVDTPDASGFFLITAIAGARNGSAILSLQPTGTPIPGNEPFAVDNLVRIDSPQLTVHGFGYAIEGETFSNPFFAEFLQQTTYLELFFAATTRSAM